MVEPETPAKIVVYRPLGMMGVMTNASTFDMIVKELQKDDCRTLMWFALTCREAMRFIPANVSRLDARLCKGGIPGRLILNMPGLRELIVPQGPERPLRVLTEDEDVLTEEEKDALTAVAKVWHLDVSGMTLTDKTMQRIGGLTALESLTLDGCNQETEPMRPIQTTALVGLSRLKQLHANDVHIGPRSMEGLRWLTSLTSLRLDGSSGHGFSANIAAATTVTELCLNNFGFHGHIPGLNGILASLTALERLELYNTGALVFLRGDALSRLRCLRHLGVGSCEWNRSAKNKNAVHSGLLCSLTTLEELDLSDNGMSEGSHRHKGMERHVSSLVNLRVLNIGANGLTPESAPGMCAHMASTGGVVHF